MISIKYQGKTIAASIFLNSNNISYYFLSAKEFGFPKINAPSRIIYEILKYNIKKGIKFTDLGGGHKSLLSFKESFSKSTKEKYVYKKVILKDIHKELCLAQNIDNPKYEKAIFFPEYK